MKTNRYEVIFDDNDLVRSVFVFAPNPEAATIIAQAERIKEGREYKNVYKIFKINSFEYR